MCLESLIYVRRWRWGPAVLVTTRSPVHSEVSQSADGPFYTNKTGYHILSCSPIIDSELSFACDNALGNLMHILPPDVNTDAGHEISPN